MTEPAGDATKFKFGLRYVRVGDCEEVDFGGPGTVTVVVGPNNVGKSTLLTQVREILTSGQLTREQFPHVVTEISSPWVAGTEDDLAAWIYATSTVRPTPSGDQAHRPNVQVFPVHALRAQMGFPTPGALTPWFVAYQTAGTRMSAGEAAPRFQQSGDPPSNPLQVLHVDADKLETLADIAKRLFGFDLFLDRTGNQFSLRMGEPTVPPYTVDSYNAEYDAAVSALPLVQDQGDGIRSAIGLLLPLITMPLPLVLLDEPEAFLHPPQARIIGSEIGNQAKLNGMQIIVATHDRSILQGVLESDAPVSVLHLSRDGNTAIAAALDSSAVAELLEDPALQYTNALEGLFHPAVIVAENERDARFYNAAIEHVLSTRTSKPVAHNLMFLGSNGKTNMARIVDGLRRLGIRVVSCPDLDVLNDEGVLRRLVGAHGGDWTEIADDYKRATNLLRDTPDAPYTADVEGVINELFRGTTETRLTKLMSDAIKAAATVPRSRWSEVKKFGREALRADLSATNRLLDKLDELGIVAVHVGELENFVTTINIAKGADFLAAAFAEGAHTQERAINQANRLLQATGIE
jgi:energy-coupling factor transporter ATP-binding protein EcfA2